MQGEFLKGDVKDVCAELKAEAKRHKGIKVAEWLKIRAVERAEAEQFGMTEAEYRKVLRGGTANG